MLIFLNVLIFQNKKKLTHFLTVFSGVVHSPTLRSIVGKHICDDVNLDGFATSPRGVDGRGIWNWSSCDVVLC